MLLIMLGFEVDKPLNFFIKTLNAAEYIELDVQNIEELRKNDPINGYYVPYKPIILSLSFLCDVCNEVHEHMQ